jgi:hypothetical protein
MVVEPRTLVAWNLSCCPPANGYFTGGDDGSVWQYDSPGGTVVRWDAHTYQSVVDIPVTGAPFYGGLCLTSVATGAGGVWVTVADVGHGC